MSGLILCGKRAKKPYYIVQTDKKIYTSEEMSYYLYNNAYLIGKEFFDDGLISFFSDELGMEDLAQKLRNLKDGDGKASDMIVAVLLSNSYYRLDEVKEFEKLTEEMSEMTLQQRLKAKADGLYNIGKYGSALKTYAGIVSGKEYEVNIAEKTDYEFYGAVWNNMGVIYEKMFLHDEALRCFVMAADLYPVTEIKDRLVIAAILYNNEYHDNILEEIKLKYGFSDADIREYEREMVSEKRRIMSDKSYVGFVKSITFDGSIDMEDYYGNIRKITEKWKNEYREETG